jgi:uncharacterized protein YqjF (DUF2071 family)
MPRPFLTARWEHVFIATYAVPPELLTPRLPPGLELDTRDGQAFVSLVPFQFLDTRVLGIGWPGHRDFVELNLRFYVHRNGERGVVFLREFVPKRLVVAVARWVYNEPYRTAPLTAAIHEDAERVSAEYRLTWAGREHVIAVTGRKPAYVPDEKSTEHYFKELRWGYGTTRAGEALRYEVIHPRWEALPVEDFLIDLDWAEVYGLEWKVLQQATPYSAVFALGSAVQVFPKGKCQHHHDK